MKFEEKLVKLRKEHTLSQEQLAEKLGVSRQAVSRWESGETTPDMANIIGLCDIFEVSADYLIREAAASTAEYSPVQTCDAPVKGKWNNTFRLIAAALFHMGTCLSIIGACFSSDAWQHLVSIICSGVCGGLTFYNLVRYGREL